MEDIIQDAQRQAEWRPKPTAWKFPRNASTTLTWTSSPLPTEEAPVIKLANLILVQAIKDRASDIHIEPFEKMVRLRYRIDGVLIDATPPPKNLQVALISRLQDHEQPRTSPNAACRRTGACA